MTVSSRICGFAFVALISGIIQGMDEAHVKQLRIQFPSQDQFFAVQNNELNNLHELKEKYKSIDEMWQLLLVYVYFGKTLFKNADYRATIGYLLDAIDKWGVQHNKKLHIEKDHKIFAILTPLIRVHYLEITDAHRLVNRDLPEWIAWFVNKGLSIDDTDYTNITALEEALWCQKERAYERLINTILDLGADPNKKAHWATGNMTILQSIQSDPLQEDENMVSPHLYADDLSEGLLNKMKQYAWLHEKGNI